MMVIEFKKPCSPLFALTLSNKCVKMSGTRRSPTPKENAAARMKRSRRVKCRYERTRTPETTTLANRNVVTPPRTELGMARKTPEILPMMPKRRRNTQHQRPA